MIYLAVTEVTNTPDQVLDTAIMGHAMLYMYLSNNVKD